MVIKESIIRSFGRSGYDTVHIFLESADWPVDIPLPADVKRVKLGYGPFPRLSIIRFETERTIEKTGSWFIVPFSVEEMWQWYHDKMMAKNGWLIKKQTRQSIDFHHPEKNLYLVVLISRQQHLQQTEAMVHRVAVYPWHPNGNNNYTTHLKNALWPLTRRKNGLTLDLPFHYWPNAIPLPEIASLTAKNPKLKWDFQLEADKTIEKITGNFCLTDTTTKKLKQYDTQLKASGWLKQDKNDTLIDKKISQYRHIEIEGNLSVALQTSPQSSPPYFTLQWTRLHPWSPSEDDETTAQNNNGCISLFRES